MGIALMVTGLPDEAQEYRSVLRYAAPTLVAMAAFVIVEHRRIERTTSEPGSPSAHVPPAQDAQSRGEAAQ